MTQAMTAPREFSTLTASSASPVIKAEVQVSSTQTGGAMLYEYVQHTQFAPVPDGYRDIAAVAAEYEANPKRAAALAKARRTLAAAQVSGANKTTLAICRLSRGLSQKQLAEMIGTSQSRLSRIEGGLDDMLYSTFEKLVGALEISRDELAEAIQNSAQR